MHLIQHLTTALFSTAVYDCIVNCLRDRHQLFRSYEDTGRFLVSAKQAILTT